MINLKIRTKSVIFFIILISISSSIVAQEHLNHGQKELGLDFWFGLLEIPFLILCVVYAFLTAAQMRGGRFGSGMNLLAWGFIVMAVGHIHMQIDHFFGTNLFNNIFGESIGSIIWVTALIITWTLSAIGFIRIYKSSKG